MIRERRRRDTCLTESVRASGALPPFCIRTHGDAVGYPGVAPLALGIRFELFALGSFTLSTDSARAQECPLDRTSPRRPGSSLSIRRERKNESVSFVRAWLGYLSHGSNRSPIAQEQPHYCFRDCYSRIWRQC